MLGVGGGDRPQRAQHLHLLVAHRGRVEVGRRLHRHQREQLEHVVLHHVAQRAGALVIIGAALQPDRLGDGDLHVVDVRRVPQRLEQHVGEPQREQVLDRLLAEIMVDAERAVLGKGAATASLISRLDSRSVPSGFSSAMRDRRAGKAGALRARRSSA